MSVASSSSSLPVPFFFDAPLLPALGLRGGAGAVWVDAAEKEDDEVDGVLAAASAAALPAFSVAVFVCVVVYIWWVHGARVSVYESIN